MGRGLTTLKYVGIYKTETNKHCNTLQNTATHCNTVVTSLTFPPPSPCIHVCIYEMGQYLVKDPPTPPPPPINFQGHVVALCVSISMDYFVVNDLTKLPAVG